MQRIDLIGARPRTATGVLAAIAAVALTTALIYPLREVVPAVSTGVTYLVAVLVISSVWGLRLGLFTAVLSALCFNWFHIPPTGRLSIAEGENWVALAVFFVAAAIASSLAELARARAEDADVRRREASLSAEMARLLLADVVSDRALAEVAARLAEAMGLAGRRSSSASIRPRPEVGRDPARRRASAGSRPCSCPPTSTRGGASRSRSGSPRRWRRCSRRPSSASGSAPRRSRRRPCVAATSSRRRCCARSPTTCARPLTAIVAAGDALGSPAIDRRRARRARRGRQGRVGAALAPRRPAPRPLAARVGRRRAAPRLVLDRGDRPRGRRAGRRRRLRARFDARPAARQRRRRPARAGARQRARERGRATPAASAVAVHARTVGPRLVVRVVDRGPGVPAPTSSGSSSRSTARPPRGAAGARRLRARPRDRPRLRRRQRRHDQGGVAARPGDGDRDRAAGRDAARRRGGRDRAGPRDERRAGSSSATTSRRSSAPCGSSSARPASRSIAASDGEEALDRAAVQPPDAAIIDLVLPDIDGVEVCRRLREWTSMPIIVLSAVGDEVEKVRALEAGADDYVTKPFGPRELVARLQATLRRAGAGRRRAGARRRRPRGRPRGPGRPPRRRGGPPDPDRVRRCWRRWPATRAAC